MKNHKASPEMQKFFQRLINLKAYVLVRHKISAHESLEERSETLAEIYARLDAIIRSTEET